MRELMQDITCLLWLILAILTFARLQKWDRKFSEMYDELKHQIEEEFND